MRIRVGCEFGYEAESPTPVVWQVRPRIDGRHQVVASTWASSPFVPASSYVDSFGNVCDRLSLPEGATTVRYDALVDVPAQWDEADKAAAQVPVDQLPDDVLMFLLASRFCLPDVLMDTAWELFGATRPGWDRVQAVCDWTHDSIRYEMGSSTALTTGAEAFAARTGV
jgi:transglutaminase-like putative cysteine protease